MATFAPPPNAAQRTFAIAELLENILLQLDRDEPRAHYGFCLLGPLEQLFTLQRKKMSEPERPSTHCGKCLAKAGTEIIVEKYIQLLGRRVANAMARGFWDKKGSWRQIAIVPAELRCQLVGRVLRVDFQFEEPGCGDQGWAVGKTITCGQVADEMRVNEEFTMCVDVENVL
ncbi:hypothetical protein Slin15195_G120100 [Septoria linicola]|uniref:Uncharacterized protein n=1 Tax=Septoria linicola TaxID=215465 RepID=A0A9Q9B999_9PEZI|nr:hypothetical protein Slin15195_G120100 [Septoria linicola]